MHPNAAATSDLPRPPNSYESLTTAPLTLLHVESGAELLYGIQANYNPAGRHLFQTPTSLLKRN